MGSHAMRTAPYDVILACLIEDGDNAPSLTRTARLIEAALIEYGHLPEPERPRTNGDLVEAAQWLAEASRHPRFTQTDEGWRQLLTSEAMVDMAAVNASKGVDKATRDHVAEIRRWLHEAIRGAHERR